MPRCLKSSVSCENVRYACHFGTPLAFLSSSGSRNQGYGSFLLVKLVSKDKDNLMNHKSTLAFALMTLATLIVEHNPVAGEL